MIVAAIDIGSNTVRLLTVTDDGSEIRREVAITGLAAGVDGSGVLSADAVERTADVLVGYARAMDEDGVEAVAAVATSACRDARNGEQVMDRLARAMGFRPEIIRGDEEAALAFSGATAGSGGASTTVIDIGGGSTEIIVGGDEIAWSHSYDIGSVRLTDRVLPDRPVTGAELRAAQDATDHILASPSPPSATGTVIGVAGTFTSLSAIALGLDRYDRDAVHGSVLSSDDLDQLTERLSPLTVAQTAQIPSLDPKRAPVILAGSVIASRCVRMVDAAEIVISEHDLLDGLAAAVLAGRRSSPA